jgi:hypothetical protein
LKCPLGEEEDMATGGAVDFSRMLKSTHLLRCPHLSPLRGTTMYDSLLGMSGALHLDAFEHPAGRTLMEWF